MSQIQDILDRMDAQEAATAHFIKCDHAGFHGLYVVAINGVPVGAFNRKDCLVEVLQEQITSFAQAAKTNVFFVSGEDLHSQDITEQVAAGMARAWFEKNCDSETTTDDFPAFCQAKDGGVSDDLIESADAYAAGQEDLRSHYRASVL